MIYGFYFRFLKFTHCERLSVFLSKIAYGILFIRYLCERFVYKEKKVSFGKEEALKIISEQHPDPRGNVEFDNKELCESVDVTIIVPVYNHADLLDYNIQSILNQETKYRYEVILVDDGSTDGAQEIVHKYETDSRVRTIFQKNQGIAGARNTGLNAAIGRYIMFVDCDDTVASNIVEILLEKAYQDNCDIVMCAHNLVKERNGKVYSVIPNVYPHNNMLGYPEKAQILNYAGLPWGKVYKRELWKDVRFLTGYWYEDNIIQSLLFTQCKKFSYVPIICYQYRWYERNFSHTQGNARNLKSIDMYWMLVPILEKYKELGLPRDERLEILLLKHLSSYYYSKISGLNEKLLESMFILACDLYDKNGITEEVKLPYMLRVTKKALIQRDINLWKLASRYQK